MTVKSLNGILRSLGMFYCNSEMKTKERQRERQKKHCDHLKTESAEYYRPSTTLHVQINYVGWKCAALITMSAAFFLGVRK